MGNVVLDMTGVSNSANESIDDDLLYSAPRMLPVLAGERCVTPLVGITLPVVVVEALALIAVETATPRLVLSVLVDRFRDKTGMVVVVAAEACWPDHSLEGGGWSDGYVFTVKQRPCCPRLGSHRCLHLPRWNLFHRHCRMKCALCCESVTGQMSFAVLVFVPMQR